MSALIFVALAGAWAVYLVPKALKQHEDAEASRSVESFSDRMRVLDPRRAPSASAASAASAASSVAEEVAQRPSRDHDDEDDDEDDYVLEPVRLSPVQLRMRRSAARRAAERRRRVLGSLLMLLAVVVVAAVPGWIPRLSVLAPIALVVAWLVACRLMVKKETAARTRLVKKRRTTLADQAVAEEDSDSSVEAAVATGETAEDAPEETDGTEEIPAVGRASAATWEPVPMTLPTYVGKAAASRSVRTIDLDSTGVWSSGRNAGDSELAREAETSRREQREQREVEEKASSSRRASGS